MERPDQKAGAYRLEEQVGHLLRRAHQRATAIFQTTVGDPQLTPTQFAAVIKLYDEGELSQNHLGRLTAMDPATIQGVCRRLTERGFVEARPDPDDRRRSLLRLTPTGTALIDTMVVDGKAVTDKTLEPLTAEERRTFLALLQRLT